MSEDMIILLIFDWWASRSFFSSEIWCSIDKINCMIRIYSECKIVIVVDFVIWDFWLNVFDFSSMGNVLNLIKNVHTKEDRWVGYVTFERNYGIVKKLTI